MKIEERTLSELCPSAYNPRKISEEAMAGLTASLRKFGCVEPIVLNERTNTIVGGHQRLMVLEKLGEQRTPVVIVDLSETDEKALNVTLNNPRIQGEWDTEKLFPLLEELKLDLPEYGDLLLEELSPPEEIEIKEKDDILPEQCEQRTKPGDLWLLGEHRVLCGDCTVAGNVSRLLNGAMPNLMVTDPPYGVSYDPSWRIGIDKDLGVKRSTGKVLGDTQSDWSVAYSLFPGDVTYVWHAGKVTAEIQKNLEDCGFEIISQIVWKKQHFVFSRGDYHWQHEVCWYATRKGKKHNWQGARDQSTIWNIDNNNNFGHGPGKEKTWGHGTQKPVECMLRPILNNSEKGEIIYDPFLGSGTTVIAADKAGRHCYGLEIDPKYCDIIVQRWQEFSGNEAVLEEIA